MEWTLDEGLRTTNYKTRTAECELDIKRRQLGREMISTNALFEEEWLTRFICF